MFFNKSSKAYTSFIKGSKLLVPIIPIASWFSQNKAIPMIKKRLLVHPKHRGCPRKFSAKTCHHVRRKIVLYLTYFVSKLNMHCFHAFIPRKVAQIDAERQGKYTFLPGQGNGSTVRTIASTAKVIQA